MANIHDCRVVVEVNTSYRKVCRLAFPKSDASLYLIPYGRQHMYLWGEGAFPEGAKNITFEYADKKGTPEKLKLTIHQSGQVHVKSLQGQDYKAGPLWTKPLWEYRGEHLASISIDSLTSLPSAGKLKPKPKSPELILRAADVGQSRRFVLYANGAEPRFVFPVKAWVRMSRAGLPSPLYIGLAALGQKGLVEGEEGGVSIICGWNVSLRRYCVTAGRASS
jgi:hypothetical protein